jgi:WD40 repeat protein
MRHRPHMLGAICASLAWASVAQATPPSRDCEPAEHPPNPESSFERTRTARLSNMIGNYGFDLPGAVYALAVSADGSRVLAGGSSRTALLWHVKAGRALRELPLADRDVTAVAFSPDGKRGLVGFGLSGSDGYPVYVWDLISGNRTKALDGHSWDVTAVAFSHNGDEVLSASRDGQVKLWDPETGELLNTFEHPWQVLAAAFSPDDEFILSAGRDGTLFLWDLNTGEQVRTFEGLHGPVRSIAFSTDGKHVLAATDDGRVREWDAASGRPTRTLMVATGGPTLEFPAQLVAAAAESQASLTGMRLTLSEDGEHLLAALSDGTLLTWHLSTLKLEDPVQAPVKTEWTTGRTALSPDGRLAAQGLVDGRVRLHGVETHADISTGQHVEGGMEKLTVAPDGQRFFALNATTHRLMLLDGSGATILTYPSAGEGRFGMRDKLAVITQVNDATHEATIHLVDPMTGAIVRGLSDPAYVMAFMFSPDGRQVIAFSSPLPPNEATKGYLSSWDVKTGRKSQDVTPPFAGPTLFLPDGKHALTAPPGRAGMDIWDLSTGQVTRSIAQGVAGLRPLAISPDAQLVATTSASDKVINLWSLQTGDVLRALKGHRCIVRSATFSSDGKRLLSIGGQNEELRLWDGAKSEQTDAIDLTTHNDHAVSAAFSTDGKSFLLGTGRGVIMRYDFAGEQASSE